MINKLQRQINRIDRKGVFTDKTVEAYNKRTKKLEKLLQPKIEKEIKDYFKGRFLSKRDFCYVISKNKRYTKCGVIFCIKG